MVSIRFGPTRTALLLVTLGAVLAIVCVLSPSEGAQAALTDPEPPAQYDDHAHAYDMETYELGTTLTIRKEGGGDRDYIKLGFLNLNDVVTVNIDQSMNTSNQVEYWVEDPNLFPIYFYQYNGLPANPIFSFNFAVLINGPYYILHGSGLGTTVISMNITVYTDSWVGDGNDRPEYGEEVHHTKVVDGSFGQPKDPADFYKLLLDPIPSLKTFLSFSLSGTGWTRAHWELYNSCGILRQNLSYTQDALYYGDSTETFGERILEPETHYLRVWCMEGSGDYRLYFNIVTYPEDGDDWMDGAQELVDGQTVNGTIHTKYDASDHYRIDLVEGDLTQLWMDVDDDADIFLLEEGGRWVAGSDNWDDESEHISYKIPPGGSGTYYVRVTMSTELDPFPLREISYQLRVVMNLPPQVDSELARTYGSWPMLEDRVDEGILLTDLFFDPEGGPLSFQVLPGHNASRLKVTVTGADRLRLEPAENVSGLVESVTVEAMDGRGKTTRFTIDVAVIAVNDAPVVGHPTAGPPPEVLEFDEDTTGGPWDLLFWFWDCDNAMSEMTFSFETDLYLNAEMDDLDRLVIETLVPDWNGRTNITIRVRDPEGLGALIRMPVVVGPVNDPPRRIGPDLEVVVTGGMVAMVDVAGSFMDPDGDVLRLYMASNQDLAFTFIGYIITVDGLLPYQFSTVGFNVTVKDPQDAVSSPLGITLEVRDMDDPHTIQAWETEYTLLWGRGRYFTEFTVSDPDQGHYEYEVVLSVGDWSDQYKYRRTTNGWEWASPRPYWAPEWGSEEGDVVITLVMHDSWYNASVSWLVHVRAENNPPEILKMLADTKGPYWLGQDVEFSADAVDKDGDDISYEWYLDGDLMSEESRFTLTFDSTGELELVLEVSDGFNTTQRELPFAVVEEEESLDPPILTLALVLVVAVVVILVGVFVWARR